MWMDNYIRPALYSVHIMLVPARMHTVFTGRVPNARQLILQLYTVASEWPHGSVVERSVVTPQVVGSIPCWCYNF